jgi:hypothetical protein
MLYFVYKLLFWQHFSVGVAPLDIGFFLFGSLQLVSLGIIGEYIGNIQTQVQNRPLVFERDRINFEFEPGPPQQEPAIAGRSGYDLRAAS